MKSQSSLFTDAEWEALKRRLSGDKADPTGIYANRVKPKLREIASWRITPLKQQINKLLQDELQDKPTKTEEQSFEEFKQETGY